MRKLILYMALIMVSCFSYGQSVEKSKTALRMDKLGFQNIAEKDSTIAIRLMYARPDNFVGKVMYTDLKEAYLHPEAMKSLMKAQKLLQQYHPGYRLVIYDAARPMAVQQQMWNAVKGTSKNIYVSNPARGGGLHNYGMAVDVSIIDAKGDSIPMGTKVDYLGKAAHITNEAQMVKEKKMSQQAYQNRLLLRRVMTEAGFRPLSTEWWHFNRVTRAEAKARYKVIP